MSLTTEGLEELRASIQRLGAVEGVANNTLKELAGEIAETARQMAPVDEGNLEKAIKIKFEPARGLGGRFAAGGQWAVYVDNNIPVPGRPDKTVGDYVWEMHEHLEPYGAGQYKLGEKSREKQQSVPVEVGGKFLERAVEAHREGVYRRLAEAIFKMFTRG